MKYLLTPEEYRFPNPRIDGFRKLKEVNAHTVDVFCFSPELFNYFLRNKELPQEFIKELAEVSEKMISLSLNGAVYIRRAFVVSGLENPPGPWFRINSSQEAVNAVKELYNFAISQKYHQRTGSQISGFIHPAIGDKRFNGENINASEISYGGYATIDDNKIEVYAVFGMNEGVQSLVADHYSIEVKNRKFLINEKSVPQKNKMLCPSENSRATLFNVPLEIQFEQILFDDDILEISKVLYDLFLKYGPQRVEFAVDAGRPLLFNEAADYWKTVRTDQKKVQVRGRILEINGINDLSKISNLDPAKLRKGECIILVGKNIIIDRNYNVLGALANRKDNLYILYPGVAATQHAMRVLADKGHKAFLVGNQKFAEGDEVQIITVGSKVRVTNLTRAESQEFMSLWDASLFGVELCGGKADRLSKLKILGFQVPHGSVLTTVVFDKILKELGFQFPVKLADFQKAEAALAKPGPEIMKYIEDLISDYCQSGKFYAVRSSATIEDNAKQSLAGMFETFLNIRNNDLTGKTIEVFRSAFAPRTVDYLKNNLQLVSQLKMAVTVQEMVSARVAGVIFGAKVQTGDQDIVEIEANKGLGEGIVSGQAKEVEQYKFSRVDKRIVERKGPEILSHSEAKALFMLSERLRQEFSGIPQDIEWAIDQENQIWVLQSRDLFWGR